MIEEPRQEKASKPVSWQELLNAFEFASFGGPYEHQAFVCKDTGEIFCRSDFDEDAWEVPDDIEDDAKYIQIPDKRELGLGKALVLDFARAFLPADYNEVQRMFGRKGAYARFKDLLLRRNALDRWNEFEAEASEKALKEWCYAHQIALRE